MSIQAPLSYSLANGRYITILWWSPIDDFSWWLIMTMWWLSFLWSPSVDHHFMMITIWWCSPGECEHWQQGLDQSAGPRRLLHPPPHQLCQAQRTSPGGISAFHLFNLALSLFSPFHFTLRAASYVKPQSTMHFASSSPSFTFTFFSLFHREIFSF